MSFTCLQQKILITNKKGVGPPLIPLNSRIVNTHAWSVANLNQTGIDVVNKEEILLHVSSLNWIYTTSTVVQDKTTWLFESKKTNVNAETSSGRQPVYNVFGLTISQSPSSLHNIPKLDWIDKTKQTDMHMHITTDTLITMPGFIVVIQDAWMVMPIF